jgi:hypothetical protein
MPFWKRKKEPEFISLGLNREATAEEKAIAERRDEGPEPELFEKLKTTLSPSASNRQSARLERSILQSWTGSKRY